MDLGLNEANLGPRLQAAAARRNLAEAGPAAGPGVLARAVGYMPGGQRVRGYVASGVGAVGTVAKTAIGAIPTAGRYAAKGVWELSWLPYTAAKKSYQLGAVDTVREITGFADFDRSASVRRDRSFDRDIGDEVHLVRRDNRGVGVRNWDAVGYFLLGSAKLGTLGLYTAGALIRGGEAIVNTAKEALVDCEIGTCPEPYDFLGKGWLSLPERVFDNVNGFAANTTAYYKGIGGALFHGEGVITGAKEGALKAGGTLLEKGQPVVSTALDTGGSLLRFAIANPGFTASVGAGMAMGCWAARDVHTLASDASKWEKTGTYAKAALKFGGAVAIPTVGYSTLCCNEPGETALGLAECATGAAGAVGSSIGTVATYVTSAASSAATQVAEHPMAVALSTAAVLSTGLAHSAYNDYHSMPHENTTWTSLKVLGKTAAAIAAPCLAYAAVNALVG